MALIQMDKEALREGDLETQSSTCECTWGGGVVGRRRRLAEDHSEGTL